MIRDTGGRSQVTLGFARTDGQVADIIWSMNAAEYWDLLVRERSWTPDQFQNWLTDAWIRLLLLRGP